MGLSWTKKAVCDQAETQLPLLKRILNRSCLQQLSTDTILLITVELEDVGRDTFVSPLPSPAQSEAWNFPADSFGSPPWHAHRWQSLLTCIKADE